MELSSSSTCDYMCILFLHGCDVMYSDTCTIHHGCIYLVHPPITVDLHRWHADQVMAEADVAVATAQQLMFVSHQISVSHVWTS